MQGEVESAFKGLASHCLGTIVLYQLREVVQTDEPHVLDFDVLLYAMDLSKMALVARPKR